MHTAIYWRNLKCARFRIFSLVSALFCLNFAYSFYLSSINAMHIAIYWHNLKCARFRIFFFCQLYFILISLSLCIWARSTPCILQSIGVIWRAVDLEFFSLVSFILSIGVIRIEPDLEFFLLSALLCPNLAYSLYLSSINAMHSAIYWCNLNSVRFRIFFSCQLYLFLISLTLCMWPRSTPCILQSIGVIWIVPDLEFFSCQPYFVLISLTLYIWAWSTPCILQSIGVIFIFIQFIHVSLINAFCFGIHWRQV